MCSVYDGEGMKMMISLQKQIEDLRQSIQVVKDLHQPKPKYIGDEIPCVYCGEIMPCQTLTILSGKGL